MGLEVQVIHMQGSRECQEDSYLASYSESSDTGIFAVADGLGGHGNGDKASQAAVIAARQNQERTMAAIFAEAQLQVRTVPMMGFRHPGTTLTVARIQGTRLEVGHQGDSRCYLLRGRQLRLLTHVHRLGRHHLSQCLGQMDTQPPQTLVRTLRKGDRVILATDGLEEGWPDAANRFGVVRLRPGQWSNPSLLVLLSSPWADIPRLVGERLVEGADNTTVVMVELT